MGKFESTRDKGDSTRWNAPNRNWCAVARRVSHVCGLFSLVSLIAVSAFVASRRWEGFSGLALIPIIGYTIAGTSLICGLGTLLALCGFMSPASRKQSVAPLLLNLALIAVPWTILLIGDARAERLRADRYRQARAAMSPRDHLLECVRHGPLNREEIRRYVAEGTDINSQEGNATPLMAAVQNQHADGPATIRFLVRLGAEVNLRHSRHGWSALHFAVKNGSLEVVKTLVQLGADVHAVTNRGETALDLARRNRLVDGPRIVEFLVELLRVDE